MMFPISFFKWFISLLVFLGTIVLAQGQDTLELEAVIELARVQALPAYKAQVDVQKANWAYKSYRASLKPQLRLRGNVPNYTNSFFETIQPDGTIQFQRITYNNSFLSLQASQDIPLTGASVFVQSDLQRYDDVREKFRSYNGVPLRIGILQPLSPNNPMKWEKRLAPVRLLEAEKQFSTDVEGISVEVLPFFFDLLLAQMDLQIAQTNQESNQSLVEIAQERFELGKMSENDVLQLRLELIRAQKDTRDAQQAVRAAQTILGTYLGIDPASRPLAVRIPEPKNLPIVNANRALKEALQNRPESISYQRRQLEADQAVAEVKARFGWSADLYASFGFARGSENLSDIYLDPQSEQGLFLQLSMPIMDWGRGKAERNQAKLDQTYVAQSIERELQLFQASVQRWVAHCNQMQETMQLAQEAQEISQQQFDISKNRYLLGDISITDLTLSLRAKDQARRSYLFALREYWQAWHQLRFLTLYDFDQDRKIQYQRNNS